MGLHFDSPQRWLEQEEAPTMAPTEEEIDEAVVVPWSVVWVTLLVTMAVGACLYIFYVTLRSMHYKSDKYDLYEMRQFGLSHRTAEPWDGIQSGGCFGWARAALKLSPEETLRIVGMDAFMFLRFLRLSFRISLFGSALGILILIPTYYTGGAEGNDTEDFNSVTLANVEQGSGRLWASAVCWAMFVGFALRELYMEWKQTYAPKRYEFLAHGDVDTDNEYRYAVMIEHVPRHLRSNKELYNYFNKLFPSNIHQVHVCMETTTLDKLVHKRLWLLNRLEQDIGLTHLHPDKPAPSVKEGGNVFGCGGVRTDAIPFYEREIAKLNEEIDGERARLFAEATGASNTSSETGAILSMFQGIGSNIGQGMQDFGQNVKGIGSNIGQGIQGISQHAKGIGGVFQNKESGSATEDVSETVPDHNSEGAVKASAELHTKEASGDTPADSEGVYEAFTDVKPQDLERANSAYYSAQEASSDTPAISDKMASTAFVTFTSLKAKQAAINGNISGKVDYLQIAPAPDPKAVIWDNIIVPATQQRRASMLLGGLWTAGIVFWAVPATFVTGLANLNSLLETFGISKLNSDSFFYGLLAGLLPPLALQGFMVVLCLFINFCAASVIRKKSSPEVDNYTFSWYMLYQFANLWLILIGGSAFNQLDAMINDPRSIAKLMASAIPGAATFFLNMIILNSCFMSMFYLSNLAEFGQQIAKSFIEPRVKTERFIESKKPRELLWGFYLPPIFFIVLVSFVYMAIVPLLDLFTAALFGIYYVVWKHNCLHVYGNIGEGGGVIWERIFRYIMVCLYTAEIIMIAYMGIKEGSGQAIFCIVPFVGTIAFHQRLRRNIIGPLQNLSMEVAAEVDLQDGELSPIAPADTDEAYALSVNRKLYGQPNLKPTSEERAPRPYRPKAQGKDLSVTGSGDPVEKDEEVGEGGDAKDEAVALSATKENAEEEPSATFDDA